MKGGYLKAEVGVFRKAGQGLSCVALSFRAACVQQVHESRHPPSSSQLVAGRRHPGHAADSRRSRRLEVGVAEGRQPAFCGLHQAHHQRSTPALHLQSMSPSLLKHITNCGRRASQGKWHVLCMDMLR